MHYNCNRNELPACGIGSRSTQPTYVVFATCFVYCNQWPFDRAVSIVYTFDAFPVNAPAFTVLVFSTVFPCYHRSENGQKKHNCHHIERLLKQNMKTLKTHKPLSQASACDGNMYSICHNYQKALPNTIPLN